MMNKIIKLLVRILSPVFSLFPLYDKSCIQQGEESFYQHIGLKFEEETSKMLHLEPGFVWC